MSWISFSLDWIRCTFPFEGETPVENILAKMGGVGEETRPKGSYNNAMAIDNVTVYWHSERPEMRILLEMTGQDLSAYRVAVGSDRDLLRKLIVMGARFTRLDFAVDFFDTEGSVSDFAAKWRTPALKTKARSMTHITGQSQNEDTGETVYLGSRTSTRMIRVYHKGKQAKTNLDWIRVELEWKAERAIQMASDMRDNGVKLAGLSHLRDFVEATKFEWFETVFDESYELVNIDTIGRPQTSRERWVWEVVLPAVAKELEDGTPGFLDALESLLLANEDRTNRHGPTLRNPNK